MNPGYIYILQNPSLAETHLKIGRTERDPDERAAEISRGTGVPTPFEVVWWSESIDCHLAESILHDDLDSYRTTTAREFFDIELDEAIRAAKRAIRQSGGRTGGIGYLFRRLSFGMFHGIICPLLRLPIQIVLLAGLIAWWILKTLLFPSTKKGNPAKPKQKKASAASWNPFYLKEILGLALWIALVYCFLTENGPERFRKIFSQSSLGEILLPDSPAVHRHD